MASIIEFKLTKDALILKPSSEQKDEIKTSSN